MTTLTAGQPDHRIAASVAGRAIPAQAAPSGATAIRVGVTDVGSAVLRIEFGFGEAAGGPEQWIDAGTSLDLDASTQTVLVPLTGVRWWRVAVRIAADAEVGVWIGRA